MGLATGGDYWGQFQAHTQVQPQRSSQPAGPAAPGTFTPTKAPGSGGGDPQALVQQWQQSHPFGSPGSGVQDLVSYLQAQGINASVPTHAGGTQLSTDKIVLPDQSVVDVANDNGWQYSGGDGYFVNGQPSSTPGVVTPFASSPNGGGSLGSLGGGTTGLVNGQGYVLPSAQDALNSPGLQFALQQGEQGIMRNAAAKGTLRSGGTLKDLATFDEGTALQGYGNLVNQQLAANTYNTGNLFNLANIGANAAAQTGTAGQNYAAGASNTLTGMGNANAAGSIAGGNAVSSALTGGANSILQAYLFSQYGGGNPNAGLATARGGGSPYGGAAQSPADY